MTTDLTRAVGLVALASLAHLGGRWLDGIHRTVSRHVRVARVQAGDDCADGVVKDDGSLETGLWLGSLGGGRALCPAIRGRRFRFAKDGGWSASVGPAPRPDDRVSFSVQLYRDRGGQPAPYPEASVDAVATAVPAFPDGAFYSVDVSGVDMRATTDVFYIGVQWDPSQDGFFFVCVDQTETTPVEDGWFIDDRADEWTSVLESSDPIFDDHHAMMIRARAAEGLFPLVPTLGTWGLLILIGAISTVGALVLRRGGYLE